MSTKTFTLIELLVVIAIIAILAAILFPVRACPRERAQVHPSVEPESSSLSHMIIRPGLRRALSSLLLLPGADFCDLPPERGSRGGAFLDWIDFIYPYVKNEQRSSAPARARWTTTIAMVQQDWTQRTGGGRGAGRAQRV